MTVDDLTIRDHENAIMSKLAAAITAGGLHAQIASHGTGQDCVTVIRPGQPRAGQVTLLYEGFVVFERCLGGDAASHGTDLVDTCNRLLSEPPDTSRV
jgi:hypothetical protein